MVKFDKVSKRFGHKLLALDNISVEIASGEFAFLVGPSGAGKTTFLRLLTRDLMPSSGHVYVDKWDLAKLSQGKIPLLRRMITMVFQDFKVLSDRTVFENVAVTLEIQSLPQTEIATSVEEVLDLVNLQKKVKLFPAQLSAGELQRVSIARAVVGKPKILLADEPTGNLDPQIGWEIIRLLGKINKRGTTVIMATHNIDIVNSLKRRVIELRQGKMVRDEQAGKYL